MVGYTEALTDPSYNGQLLALTYPLVGNYGVPDPLISDADGIPKFFESDKIQARGLVVHELSLVASHWNAHMTLDEWLYNENVPGISGIDTRALTKKLRTGGVMMAALAVSDNDSTSVHTDTMNTKTIQRNLANAPLYTSEQFMNSVSTSKPRAYGCDLSLSQNTLNASQKINPVIVIIDTGAKHAILRNVRSLGYGAILVPWNTSYDQIMSYNPAGVVLSSGPGDPENCPQTIQTAKELIKNNIPTLGICLGAQILGLAGNASTYKLKYGHRGQNKPCINLETGQTYVTSQNHGYGILPSSLPDSEFELWFLNADDNTVEGIRHKSNRCIAVQFHPEASPGPYDCKFVFEDLQRLIEGGNDDNGGVVNGNTSIDNGANDVNNDDDGDEKA